MAAPNVASAAAFGKKFVKEILGKVWSDLTKAGITVYPNIKGPTNFGKLSAGAGLKAYTGTYSATGDVTFTQRELTPKLATYEIDIEPKKYYNTWMAEMIRANSTAMDIPFENFMWDEIRKEIVHELINKVVGIGDTTAVDVATKIADGFIKIINAIGLSEVATGAITAADVIDQIEEVYESVPARFRQYEMNAYCSWGTNDKYNKKYRELYHGKASYNEFGQTTLDIGGGKCKLMPVEWLTGDQIIITPQKNLVMGTDNLGDMNTIKMVEQVHVYNCAVTFSMGFQLADAEPIWINDQL